MNATESIFKRRSARLVFEWLTRLILGGVMLAAGILKAADPGLFAGDIRNYQLLSDPAPALLALGLPWLEILVGLSIIVGKLYRGALVIAAGMLVVFLGALASAWLRKLDINCGCFGRGEGKSNYAVAILRNFVLLGMCIALAWMKTARTQAIETS